MKHNKKLFMILLVAFLLVGLGTLAATEVTKNDTSVTKTAEVTKTNTASKDTASASKVQTTTKNDDNKEIVDTKPNSKTNNIITNKTITKTNSNKALKTATTVDVRNYTALNSALTRPTSDEVIINIQEDITLSGGITVNGTIKTLTINGNKNTINGNGSHRFLFIPATTNVLIGNIIITNCSSSSGGAIYTEGNLTVTNSNLTHNTANVVGGAIYATANSTITITNTNLQYNNATQSGGAIYGTANSNITITNSNLTDNNAILYHGGAIYGNKANTTITITNSNLKNNTAKYDGGAISTVAQITIIVTNSTLTNNTAGRNGGAIVGWTNNTIIIQKSNFTNNNANNVGGAISAYDNSTITIQDSNLKGNNATYWGGAIQGNINSTITIQNTTLTNNTAGRYGGAIQGNNEGTITATNSTLTNNTARSGGAISNGANSTTNIIDSTISNNTAKLSGGAVYTLYNSTVTVEDSVLDNNRALGENQEVKYNNITYVINGETYNGNATGINNVILFDDDTLQLGEGITINIDGNPLTQGNEENNQLESGVVLKDGVFYLPWYTNLTIDNNKQVVPNGTMIITDGFIRLENDDKIIPTNSINRSNFNSLNGTITLLHSKVILPGDYTLFDDTNVTIRLDDGAGDVGDGGAIFGHINSTINVTNSTLTYNTATTHGGAIYGQADSNITITDSNFRYNNAKESGGAIFGRQNSLLTITDSTFTHNNAGTYGGAIHGNTNSTITVTNSNLKNNTANLGGAISGHTNSTITITQNNITHNTATQYAGGAIRAEQNSTLRIQNSNLTHNNATTGGAIYGNTNSTITVTNTYLTHNNATGSGGAIYGNTNSTITVTNTYLTDNKAGQGGAILGKENSTITITDSDLTHNNAGTYGGAIYYGGTININNTNLTGNNANQSGGAIYGSIKSIITVTNSNLLHNTATWNGGAIYGLFNSTITVSNSNLTHNNANVHGGAIIGREDSTITITYSNLTNNNANERGGAVSVWLYSTSTITHSTLHNNTAGIYGGAIYNNRNATTHIVDSTVSDNVANGSGGAVYNFNGTVSIEDSVFDNNVALGTPNEVRNQNATYVINGITHNGRATSIGSVTLFDDRTVLLGSEISISMDGTPLTSGDEANDRLGAGAVLKEGVIYLPWDTNITINGRTVLVPNGTMIVTDNRIILQDGRNITTDITKSNANGLNGTIILPDSNVILPSGTRLFSKINVSIRLDDGVQSGNGGGAINNDYNASLTVINTGFNNNRAVKENGGAILNQMNSTLIITDNSRFENNSAKLTGGAISSDTNSSMTLQNSRLTSNVVNSADGYVVDFSNADNIVIMDNTFRNNTDNARDMLFSDARDGASVEIHDNTYIDNFLETFAIEPEIHVITNTTGDTYKYIDVKLRDIYNDTVRNGNLTVFINGNHVDVADVGNGRARILFKNSDLTQKENNVTLEYTSPNKNYQNSKNNFTINKEINTTLSIEAPDNMYAGETAQLNFTVKDNNNNPLANERIEVFVNDVSVANITTDDNGVANYTFTASGDEKVHIEAIHRPDSDSYYMGTNGSVDIEIEKHTPQVNITVNPNGTITANVTNENGNPIPNIPVNITLPNGTPIGSGTTCENGTVEIPTDLEPGDHDIVVTTPEDEENKATNKTVPITIPAKPTTMDVTATNGTTPTVKVKLTDDDGKPISNAPITVTDETGKPVATGRTGQDGTATIPVPLTVGPHNLTVSYPGDENNKPANKTVPVTADKHTPKVNVTVNPNGTVTVNATTENGTPIQGLPITITDENGTVIGNGTTNPNGTATVPLNTTPGDHNITITTPETSNTTKTNKTIPVTVPPKPTQMDVTVTNGTNPTVKVKLTDDDGKPITGAPITVTDKDGKPIATGRTGSDGTATIPVKLPAGTQNVTVSYPGDKNNKPTNKTVPVRTDKHTPNVTVTVDPNGTATIKATDETGTPIPNLPVVIKDETGKTIANTTTNNNGTSTVPTDLKPGNHNLTVTTPETSTQKATNKTLPISVAKIPTTTTITVPSTQAGNVRVTGTVKDKDGRNVNEGTVTIKNGATTVATTTVRNGQYNVLTNIGSKGTYTLTAEYTGTNTYLASKSPATNVTVTAKTPTITTQITGDKVGKVNVTATIKDPNGQAIPNAPITVTLPNGTTITRNTDNTGKAVIPLDLREGTNNINVEYKGNGTYNPVTARETVTVSKNTPIITLDPVRGIIGEKITLTAYLRDADGTPITGGNLAFKLNGKTLRSDGRFDSNAPAMKFSVKDGKVTYTINADLYLRNAKNLTAAYSGNYKYEETPSPTVEAQIQKRYAGVTVTASPTWNKQYDTIKFTATVRDTTKNGKNNTLINQNTKVMFKVNGNTLRNSTGQIIYVPVNSNRQAVYNYVVPAGTGGITASKAVRDYKVDAIFVGDNYYPGARNNTKFNVERSATYVNITQARVTSGNVLSVKATLKDFKGNNLIGTNKVTIKINGKSYMDPKNGKPKYWSVKNGVVDLSGIVVDSKTTIKRVMLVTGERQAYTEGRAETTNIVRA